MHDRLRLASGFDAEVVSAAFEPEGSLKALKLAKGMRGEWGASRVPTRRRRSLDRLRGVRNNPIAGLGLRSKPGRYEPLFARRQALRLPEETRASLLLDLLGEPLKVLAGFRIGREGPDGLVEQNRPYSPQAPPRGEPRPAGLARQTVGEQQPFRGHNAM